MGQDYRPIIVVTGSSEAFKAWCIDNEQSWDSAALREAGILWVHDPKQVRSLSLSRSKDRVIELEDTSLLMRETIACRWRRP